MAIFDYEGRFYLVLSTPTEMYHYMTEITIHSHIDLILPAYNGDPIFIVYADKERRDYEYQLLKYMIPC